MKLFGQSYRAFGTIGRLSLEHCPEAVSVLHGLAALAALRVLAADTDIRRKNDFENIDPAKSIGGF